MADDLLIGSQGEQHAVDYLEERGWEIVARNWKEGKIGELDVVALRKTDWDGEEVPLVAFVEVKTSATAGGIAPEVHVDAGKRRKLITLAKLFLARNKLRRVLVRFDVVGVDLEPLEVRHYPDAFDASGRLR